MKYVERNYIVEAWQFTRENLKKDDSWVRKNHKEICVVSQYGGQKVWIEIKNLNAPYRMEVKEGDYLIKNKNGEIFSLPYHTFNSIYKAVEEEKSKTKKRFLARFKKGK